MGSPRKGTPTYSRLLKLAKKPTVLARMHTLRLKERKLAEEKCPHLRQKVALKQKVAESARAFQKSQKK